MFKFIAAIRSERLQEDRLGHWRTSNNVPFPRHHAFVGPIVVGSEEGGSPTNLLSPNADGR
jgi:hypothetical protein